jgi:hypothetical protein
VDEHVIRLPRLTAAGIVAAAFLLAARPARADVMCNDGTKLPNPIIVSGSLGFEPMLRQFAARLGTEPSPSTIIYTGNTPACTGIASVLSGKDLGGALGIYYYFLDATTIDIGRCTFAAGQKADVAISEVFYESCASLPQPKPADVMDVTGPVQASIFVVPSTNSVTSYLTYAEARTVYGCGVAAAHGVAGIADPAQVFCRDPGFGEQIVVAKNIGLSPSTLTTPTCVDGVTSTGLSGALTSGPPATIGFIVADSWSAATGLIALPFQALGQTHAYALDSDSASADRRNVRDGHYTIWGYQHLIAKTSGGSLGQPVATLMGWIGGSKSSKTLNPLLVEVGAGLVPQCAMQVKRAGDGGLLSPYSPPDPCSCWYEAAVHQALPPGCTLCTSDSGCTGGKRCRHGFCE